MGQSIDHVLWWTSVAACNLGVRHKNITFYINMISTLSLVSF